MRSGIVLAGTVILDIVNIVSHWPNEESVAMMLRTEYGAGGPPHNAGAGLAKLGARFPVTCIGAVGNDTYGDELIRQAHRHGLDTRHIRQIPQAVTSHTQVMSSAATGKRTFFHQTGVNADLRPDWLMPTDDKAQIYYLGSPGIAKAMDQNDGWLTLLKAAKAKGFRTALELVPLTDDILKRFVPPLLPHVDILVINDSEAAAVSGVRTTDGVSLDWPHAEEAARALLYMGVGEVVAIHHPDGAIAVTRRGEVARSGAVNVPRDEIVGSVGAGDAFYAGVLFGLHDGWELAKCLALGNAAAATSLHSATTSASIRPYTECFDYARKCGLRAVS
jgi:sugar/nucleoside kinase (ribokinase family)